MWQRSWTECVPFLDFPVEIRKLIYTTNGIWLADLGHTS
jgi:transposase-like protein